MSKVVRVGLFFRSVLRRQLPERLIQVLHAAHEARVKAFLLAAGHGTRLRPLTDRLPKCLVPIRNVPVLGIWLELCRRFGIDEVLVNLHSHKDLIEEYVSSNRSGVKVQLSHESVLLGSAGTLRANRDWVNGQPCFWVLYADVLTTANLARMLEFHQLRNPIATLGLYRVPDPQRCGVVKFDEAGIVREFVEKPDNPSSHWAFSGLMIGTPDLLDAIPSSQPADLGFDVLPRLVGRMVAYPLHEYLLDVGTMENYRAAQTSWPGFLKDHEKPHVASNHL
jgi:mannose-1-phosphate guanylyltransferase